MDGGTQSNGEFTTMEFQTLPNGTVIGSQTAGADGNVVVVTLPRNIQFYYSGLGIPYPDGTETQRHGDRIDREVRPTVAGLKAGRDELPDEAVNIILNSQGCDRQHVFNGRSCTYTVHSSIFLFRHGCISCAEI